MVATIVLGFTMLVGYNSGSHLKGSNMVAPTMVEGTTKVVMS